MKNQTLAYQILGATLLIVLLAGCTAQPAATPMPEVPSATSTSKPIPPTSTPKPPTATPTSLPLVVTYSLVPRYMLPSAPYFSTQILGASCNYQTDEWNTQSAYIAYTCPDLDVTWLSVRFTNLEAGQTAVDIFGESPGEDAVSLPPGELLSEFDNVVVFGGKETGQSDISRYGYFMMYETESFVINVGAFFPEDTMTTLEEFYQENGEVVHHAVLELMLEKVRSEVIHQAPTPMAADQQELYDQFVPWLVTESEMNEFYKGASDMFGDSFDGTWVLIGDQVDIQRGSLCREFADRTNEDAPLVKSFNCVYQREPGYTLSKLQESFPDAVVLESAFEYPEQSIIYGRDQMHTSFQAFILRDNLLFYVFLESRALAGQTAKDVFNEYNDSIIYNVVMTNMERYTSGSIDVSDSQVVNDANDPFIGVWVAIDPGDKSEMQLSVSEDNGVYSIDFHDEIAGSCGFDSAGRTIESSGTGTGFAKGNILSTDVSLWCLSDPRSFVATLHFDYTYDQTNDTLSNSAGGGTFWNRQ